MTHHCTGWPGSGPEHLRSPNSCSPPADALPSSRLRPVRKGLSEVKPPAGSPGRPSPTSSQLTGGNTRGRWGQSGVWCGVTMKWECPKAGCWALLYSLSTSGQCESLEGGNYVKSLAKGLVLRWLLAITESPDAAAAGKPGSASPPPLSLPVPGEQRHHQRQLTLDPSTVYMVAHFILGR